MSLAANAHARTMHRTKQASLCFYFLSKLPVVIDEIFRQTSTSRFCSCARYRDSNGVQPRLVQENGTAQFESISRQACISSNRYAGASDAWMLAIRSSRFSVITLKKSAYCWEKRGGHHKPWVDCSSAGALSSCTLPVRTRY